MRVIRVQTGGGRDGDKAETIGISRRIPTHRCVWEFENIVLLVLEEKL